MTASAHKPQRSQRNGGTEGQGEMEMRLELDERRNGLSGEVIGAAIEVHRAMGPGWPPLLRSSVPPSLCGFAENGLRPAQSFEKPAPGSDPSELGS